MGFPNILLYNCPCRVALRVFEHFVIRIRTSVFGVLVAMVWVISDAFKIFNFRKAKILELFRPGDLTL